ncbi:MAG: DUF1553 domain-containing protein [Planctomycetota bacterium]|nr:DUF1553 domain-containing protein [Planctomycetota bacterium]
MPRSSLFILYLFIGTAASANEYAELVESHNPALYWSYSQDQGTGTLKLIPEHANSLPPRRGIGGLAGTYSRSSLSGRCFSKLDHDANQALTELLNGSFTFEVWFLDQAGKPNDKINYSILYKADGDRFTENSMWLYRKRQDGNLLFTIQSKTDANIRLEIENPALITPGNERRFHHLAISVSRTKNYSRATAYLNGQAVARTSIEGVVEFHNDGDWIIGNNHFRNSPWEGRLDEIALYSRALTQAEISKHFETGSKLIQPAMKRSPSLAEKERFFETSIRPLLRERCAECHSGEDSTESPFSVQSREDLITGGLHGPSIVPFRAEDSLLIAAVQKTHKELRMPPGEDDNLTRQEIALFYQWINDGAIWPGSSQNLKQTPRATVSEAIEFDPETDWAFVPRRVTHPPKAGTDRWNRNPIDQFLEAARSERKFTSNPRADRRTLIRRATLDLTGLPPTVEELTAYLEDPADEQTAFSTVVDRLLQSPRYGERQGRLWLDVARYADTQGDVGDIPIHSAYLYRNWVINALNDDMPYNSFIQAQIAGDILAVLSSDSNEAKGLNVATGFIALSRRFGNRKADSLHMTIEDTMDTLGRGVMGITLRCARCHDHKFDPIPTADYYGIYGVFQSTVYPWMGMSDEKSPLDLNPHDPLKSSSTVAREYWELIARYEYQINNHFRPWLQPTLRAFKKADVDLKSQAAKLVELQGNTNSDPNVIASLRESIESLKEKRESHRAFRSGKFRELMLHGLEWVKQKKDKLGKEPPYDFVFSVREGDAADSPIHLRGNPENPGKVIPRHFLSTIKPVNEVKIDQGSGRLQLAQWLTEDSHPLTARVLVNRIWAQHFGQGIVTTLDNFGRQGARPSHPQLLDWLAESFIADGWSIKKLHRRIMLTETYQLSSLDGNPGTQNRDPGNRWLWRFSRRRLDAESIRDSILFTSGELNTTQPGAHPLDPWYKTRYNLNNPFHSEYDHDHRSVYLITQRIFRHSILGLFDSPDTNSSTAERPSTTSPAQALFLMNSRFIRRHSNSLARLVVDQADTDNARIDWLFNRIYGRSTTESERERLSEFLESYRQAPASLENRKTDSPPEYQALCRVLLTTNHFFFID